MDNYDYYLVIRPLFSKFERENDQPVVRPTNVCAEQIEKGRPLNFSNLAKIKSNSIITMFHDDKKINCLWNNPLKYVKTFKKCLAVLTPDFTIQNGMDIEMIRMNTYRNRWLGCTWQQYGINVITTVSWAGPETYDICFSGISNNTIVAVSTIGCQGENERQIFLRGYKELLKRKSPSLVLVYGKLIEGMTGKIFPIEFQDCFAPKNNYYQIPLIELSKIICLKDGDIYGR